jgi:hypothetical protein
MKKPKRLNSVSITLGIIAIFVGYFCWFLVPAFWPVFQLTGIMRGACNNAYRELNDEKVMDTLLKDSRRTKLRLSKDNFRFTREPYTDEELNAMATDYARGLSTKRGKECVIEMYYQDNFAWPLIGQTTEMTFEREVRVPLDPVKWEKGCTCVTTSQP